MITPDDALLSGPSAQLLRAIGDLQLAPLHENPSSAVRGIGLIGDMDALALASGLAYSEIPALIAAGIAAGYSARGAAGAPRLWLS